MKSTKFLAFLLAGALAFTGCQKSDDDEEPVQLAPEVLSGTVSANKTLTNDRQWVLKGYVYVTSGATLTVEPGTTIKSDIGDKGALIVERGGKLIANGTADAPIVFTSGQPAGSRQPGDWGGIILLGKAPTNRATEPTIEGGVGRTYGGTDPNDNSGSLKFVRIEYAGIAAQPDSEINGLTLGAVGAGTTLENIMVSYGNDDAFEFFGGTVNARNLIAFANKDDDFDFDYGYTGSIQFAVSLRKPNSNDSDAGNGIEADNDGSGTSATPYTRPVLSNFTFIGPNNAAGTDPNQNFNNRWRRAVRFVVRNSILMGGQKGGFSIESNSSYNDYMAGLSEFKNNLVHAVAAPYKIGSDVTVVGASAAAVQAKAEADGGKTITNAADIKLTSPFFSTTPNLLPASGSPAAGGANFTGMSSFFTQVNHIGAFGTTNWAAGWTNFDPQNIAY
ncbi:MAG TPA: hypothetical protein VGE26_04340 [Sphingobacteriaceae bacterium]